MSDPNDAPSALPPGLADPTAETELIGGLLRTPRLVPAVVALIDSDQAFTNLRLGSAYRAIITAFNSGSEPTPSRVRDVMRSAGDTDPNLATWVADLLRSAPPLPDDVTAAAEKVRSLAAKRRIESELMKSLVQVRDVGVDDTEAINAVHTAMTSLIVDAPLGESLHLGTAALMETIEQIEELGKREGLPGLSTGSKDLDEVLQGLRPGQLIVVGGRPSVGKSMVVCDLFRQAARQGVGSLLFTLEMTRHDITKRVISAEGSVDAKHILAGRLTDHEWEQVSKVVSTFPHHNTAIVDEGGLTVGQIAALAAQQVRMWEASGVKPGLILIDYLQIMRASNTGRTSSRQQDLGEITVELKTLAKRLSVPIVLLSQVGRGAEHNSMKVPSLSDLRESGDIENNADVVILLHRPDYYDAEERPGEIDFIVAKNREGVTKTVTRTHLYRYSRIEDLAYTG